MPQCVNIYDASKSSECPLNSRWCLIQSRGQGSSRSLDLRAIFCLMHPGYQYPLLQEGCIAGSCSACCPPGPTGPFLASHFPASHSLVWTGAWGCSSPDAGVCIAPVELWGACQPISLICRGPWATCHSWSFLNREIWLADLKSPFQPQRLFDSMFW